MQRGHVVVSLLVDISTQVQKELHHLHVGISERGNKQRLPIKLSLLTTYKETATAAAAESAEASMRVCFLYLSVYLAA